MDSRPWVNVTPTYPQPNGVQNRAANFVSDDLPKGLSIDRTGRISGRVEGDFAYTDTILKANVKQVTKDGQVLASTPVTIEAGYFPVPLTLCFSIAFALNWWTIWALSSKRWHDRNKSAAWNLVWLVPVIGAIWAVFDLFVRRGSKGSNNYGAPPALPRLGKSRVRKTVRAHQIMPARAAGTSVSPFSTCRNFGLTRRTAVKTVWILSLSKCVLRFLPLFLMATVYHLR